MVTGMLTQHYGREEDETEVDNPDEPQAYL
jgi:hypothetical protein